MRPKPVDWAGAYRALAERYGWTFDEIDQMPWTRFFEAMKAGKGGKSSGTAKSFAQIAEGLRARKQLEQALGG